MPRFNTRVFKKRFNWKKKAENTSSSSDDHNLTRKTECSTGEDNVLCVECRDFKLLDYLHNVVTHMLK